jgi:beta-lactamase class A
VAVGLNSNAAVTLSGAARWLAGGLWYAVSWRTPAGHGGGWVNGGALTSVKPSAPAMEGFDALSPDLAGYLAGRGTDIGAVAYDVTRGVIYSYNGGGLFIMASSAKVPLLVSYLENIESQGRGPNGYEQAVLQQMIEVSDNNAAQVAYDTLGDDYGQRAHMAGWGITDYVSNPNGWGWGAWSPADMAQLLALLQAGKVLNPSDRAFALSLMNNVENDQRFGVGDSAPPGAQFWMKDGWVQGPDGAWAVNSSGIVQVGSEVYVVTVYNDELDSYGQGVDIVNHVCGAIGQALK